MNPLSKFIGLLFFAILSFNSSYSQDSTNTYIDSLIMTLVNSEDKQKVDIYHELSHVYLGIDYERSIHYSELGLDLAIGIKDDQGILQSKYDLSHIYLAYVLDYEQSMKFNIECLELAIKLDDTLKLLSINRGMSYIYSAQGEFDLALKYIDKAMMYANQLNSYPNISELNSYKGELYESYGDTASAIECYEKVLQIEKDNNFSESSNVSMIIIAHYYYISGDTDESLKYYRIALKRFQRNQNHRWTSYAHSEMARVYVLEGNLDRAEQHALEGLGIAEKYKLRKELGDNYLILSTLYDSIGDVEKSEEYGSAYSALQDSLVPIEMTIEMLVPKKEKNVQVSSSGMNGFVQAIIISFPVVLLLLFMGIRKKSK